MIQKVLKIGSSAGVILPKRILEELGMIVGTPINIVIDDKNGGVFVMPKKNISERNRKIAKLTLNFVSRYRKALENLAEK